MSKYSALIKRASNATAATALAIASLTPAIMLGGSAKAAVLTERSINMASSVPGATNNWTVNLGATWDGLGVSVQVCDSPLFDVTCYNPDDNAGSAGGAHDGDPAVVTYSSKTEGVAFSAVNPTLVGTFYARITRGSDTGSVALSTTNDLTINARVQEQLSFCVGAVDDANLTGATGNGSDFANCNDTEFSTAGVVDLGVISSVASASPVDTTTYGGNDDTGVFMIQTNAIGGAVVSYTSAGRLKIGSECLNDTSLVDQCFNSAVNFTAWNAEKFGMILEAPQQGSSKTGSGTTNLTRDGDYDDVYNWNNSSSTADPIANTNSTVADWEYAVMTFKAQAAATTPTGSYTTSANFVATATF